MPECDLGCNQSSRIAKLETQHDYVGSMINHMNAKLDQVIIGLGNVALLEVKHNNHAESLNRAFSRIEIVEKQAATTQQALAEILNQIRGMARMAVVVWACIGGTLGYLITKII